MFCKRCGSNLEKDSNFCNKCGFKVSDNKVNEEEVLADNIMERRSVLNNIVSKIISKKKYIFIVSSLIFFIAIISIIGVNSFKSPNKTGEPVVNNSASNEEKLLISKETEEKAVIPQKTEIKEKVQKQAKINISQVNTDYFPIIKVFFSVIDNGGNNLNGLDVKYFKLGENDASDITSELKLLSENESINLNLVMDISSSMDGQKIQQAKNAANNFLDIVNYNSGDKIEILSFSDYVNINQPFSNEKQILKNCINNLKTNGATAFYDSLYTALVETNKQFGHKCIIAFTDGLDNKSKYTEDDIINLSKQLSIPIYVMGIGNEVVGSSLQSLAGQTGGYYKTISDITNIEQIYKDIFTTQKSQYLMSYETKNPLVSNDWRNINISLNTDEFAANASAKYIPRQAINVDTSKIVVNNSYDNSIIKLDNNLKEELMNILNKYNTYWFSAMSNKNANLIVNATQKEKDRTNGLIQDMKDKNKSYAGYMTKAIFDLDSVQLEQEKGQYVAYISTSEYFNDNYYTGSNSNPKPNHTLWRYKLYYDNNTKTWLVDSHAKLDSFNPTNKREY